MTRTRARISTMLHDRFDGATPSPELTSRVHALLTRPWDSDQAGRIADLVLADEVTSDAGTHPKRLLANTRQRRNLATATGLALVVASAIAIVVLHPIGRSSPSPTVHALPSHLESVCGTPSSRFARFWEATTGGVDYAGVVHVGSTNIPAMSMYVSAGTTGEGVLCVTTTSLLGSQRPIRAATTARGGVIAYLGISQGQPFGAVRPGVTRVTLSIEGTPGVQVFTTSGGDVSQLQDIGKGWHAFNSPYGYSGGADEVTVRAYDVHGHLLGTETVDVRGSGGGPSPSASH